MKFLSDNTAPATPEVMAALQAANQGAARAYGDDDWTRRLDDAFSRYFERPVRAFPVSTGTAANSLALATLAPPYGASPTFLWISSAVVLVFGVVHLIGLATGWSKLS